VRSIEAHNGRKGRTAKDKKSIPQALRRAADKASDPSFRATLTDNAHAVLTYTGPVPTTPTAATTAAAATATDALAEAGAAEREREAFGSFDGFIANCTGYLRARGLPTNSYSMNGIVRTDIDLSSHVIQVRCRAVLFSPTSLPHLDLSPATPSLLAPHTGPCLPAGLINTDTARGSGILGLRSPGTPLAPLLDCP